MVSAWELTVLRALARRGCDTRLLLCDAVSPTYDLVWADGNPNQQRCLVCQSRAAGAARLQRHPFEWISRYFDAADRAAAIDWAAGLPDDGLRHAQLGNDPLGEWCYGSMTSHFRGPRLDLDDPAVQHVYRQYLSGAAQALAGCRTWLEAVQPGVLWLFNGRLEFTRVALQAARELGIGVICHERGMVQNSLRLWEYERCSQYRGRLEAVLANAQSTLHPSSRGRCSAGSTTDATRAITTASPSCGSDAQARRSRWRQPACRRPTGSCWRLPVQTTNSAPSPIAIRSSLSSTSGSWRSWAGRPGIQAAASTSGFIPTRAPPPGRHWKSACPNSARQMNQLRLCGRGQTYLSSRREIHSTPTPSLTPAMP